MALPKLTPEQSAAGLEKAAAARTARAALKAQLKSGEVTLAEVLNEGIAARMKVSSLLTALPGVGKARAAKLMEQFGIAGDRRVSGLGPRQREALEKEFGAVPA